MEIVNPDGSITQVKPGQTRDLGRDQGLDSSDKTISRRHISFSLPPVSDNDQPARLQFEVLGRNPIYVCKNDEVQMFRRFERGEVGHGDMFCVSAKDPVWYTLREVESCTQGVRRNDLAGKLERGAEDLREVESCRQGVRRNDLAGKLERGAEDLREVESCRQGVRRNDLAGKLESEVEDLGEVECVDVADFDPVKEFGIVVLGHEFDSYPKSRIRDFKKWEWFLEETGKDSEDDDSVRKHRRKRKKGVENDDEDWTGESEDDKELISKTKKAPRPKYSTRSKDHGKPTRDDRKGKGCTGKGKSRNTDEDEEDETLGGFIVDDENLTEEEELDKTEDEEEEEVDDEYDEDE